MADQPTPPLPATPTHEERIASIAREDSLSLRCASYLFYADELNAKLSASEAAIADMRMQRDAAIDARDGAALLLEQAREKARAIAKSSDAMAWRKLMREEGRAGIVPSALELAAEEAVSAWLDNEHKTNPGWWPSWEEMSELERTHRGHPLVDVIRRIVGLQHAPLNQVLDTLRFKYFVCGPWRSRALRKLSEARAALGCATEDDVPEASIAAENRAETAEREVERLETEADALCEAAGGAVNTSAAIEWCKRQTERVEQARREGYERGKAEALARPSVEDMLTEFTGEKRR